jgi:hypothetical protein
MNPNTPFTDAIAFALACMVDGARSGRRDPSHCDIDLCITYSHPSGGDPKSRGQTVDTAKRVRAALIGALLPDLGTSEKPRALCEKIGGRWGLVPTRSRLCWMPLPYGRGSDVRRGASNVQPSRDGNGAARPADGNRGDMDRGTVSSQRGKSPRLFGNI